MLLFRSCGQHTQERRGCQLARALWEIHFTPRCCSGNVTYTYTCMLLCRCICCCCCCCVGAAAVGTVVAGIIVVGTGIVVRWLCGKGGASDQAKGRCYDGGCSGSKHREQCNTPTHLFDDDDVMVVVEVQHHAHNITHTTMRTTLHISPCAQHYTYHHGYNITHTTMCTTRHHKPPLAPLHDSHHYSHH